MKTLYLFAACLLATGAYAQGRPPGPVAPPKSDVKRLPPASPETPPMPLEEMIQRLAQKEDELRKLFDTADYRLSLRVQEFEEDGSAGGEWRVVSDVATKPDGKRAGRLAEEPVSTLKRVQFDKEDIESLASLPYFVLTTDQRNRYEIHYLGQQTLDELNVFIFRLKPLRLERRVRQFEGLLYVDDRDFQVVKSYGRMVTELEEGAAELPFKIYETYREFTAGKYWLPSYTRSEDTIKSEMGEARLRLTVRITDYKWKETTAPAAAAKP